MTEPIAIFGQGKLCRHTDSPTITRPSKSAPELFSLVFNFSSNVDPQFLSLGISAFQRRSFIASKISLEAYASEDPRITFSTGCKQISNSGQMAVFSPIYNRRIVRFVSGVVKITVVHLKCHSTCHCHVGQSCVPMCVPRAAFFFFFFSRCSHDARTGSRHFPMCITWGLMIIFFYR